MASNHSSNGDANGTSKLAPIQIETFDSFPVNQVKTFEVLLANHIKTSDLIITITNPSLGLLDKQLDWADEQSSLGSHICLISFRAPLVGLYTIHVELLNQERYDVQFQAKAYDLSKVFITDSSGKCTVNESYEFSVDASEAGEGQLEIAVNEGEIPNQVQVLDNGQCIVNFVPEEAMPHVVDIKFNGHNVSGCPFVVQVSPAKTPSDLYHPAQQASSVPSEQPFKMAANSNLQQPLYEKPNQPPASQRTVPTLSKKERGLVNSVAKFAIENVPLNLGAIVKGDLLIVDPENQAIDYELFKEHEIIENEERAKFIFEFVPNIVGDFNIELKQDSPLYNLLPQQILEQFPFLIKIFDYTRVSVCDVTDGVVGHPVYFFIDASQAGSGNLEIRVASKTRHVPNYPQSESNAKIRVNFTPTEAVDHFIDVKFNGIPVPGNPFLVKVAALPQARLPIASQDLLKYVAHDEYQSFYVDFIGHEHHPDESRAHDGSARMELSDKSCRVYMLQPDLVYTQLNSVEFEPAGKAANKQPRFKIGFKPNKIGPYKLFIVVNNQLLPNSPIVSNVFDINEVKVFFEALNKSDAPVTQNPAGRLNERVTFTVDASRAGEGTLALAVVSSLSRNPVQTDVEVSERGHGLYNLTFLPTEFAPHTIDMSFNERVVVGSPFVVDIIDSSGQSAKQLQAQGKPATGQLTTNSSSANNETVPSDNRKKSHSAKSQQQQQPSLPEEEEDDDYKDELLHKQHQQLIQNFEALSVKPSSPIKSIQAKNGQMAKHQQQMTTTSKKSLAFGLVNASNVVYLESGVLENGKSQISLLGPNDEEVPFRMGKGSPQAGEPKKTFIEYKPRSIGTHTISVLDGRKDLHQYYVEICDPNLVKISGLHASESFHVGKPISLLIDSSESGEIQLDSITILAPGASGKRANGKVREEQTILGRIKSISSPTPNHQQGSNHAQAAPIKYTLTRLNDHTQELKFVPETPGKYSVDIRCLGQPVGGSALPIEIQVEPSEGLAMSSQHQRSHKSNSSTMGGQNRSAHKEERRISHRDEELLDNIIVHGVSLKSSPVNSTGAFIIETNRSAHARDFDVVITDPSNNLVNVQCYLQQDGNLLAEWTPRRVGAHKIEVLYRELQVAGSPFITEAFDPSGVILESLKSSSFTVNEEVVVGLNRKEAGSGELDAVISGPLERDLPIEIRRLQEGAEFGEAICFVPNTPGKYKLSITFGGYEVPKSPVSFVVRERNEPVSASGNGLQYAEVNRTAQFNVETAIEGELKVRIESGDREIVPKIERRQNVYTVKYKPTEVGYASVSIYWYGAHLEGSPYAVPVNDMTKLAFINEPAHETAGAPPNLRGGNLHSIEYEPRVPTEVALDASRCGPGVLKASAYCRANPQIKFSLPVTPFAANKYRVIFCCPPKVEQLAPGLSVKDLPLEATYMIKFYYNNLLVPETLASVVVAPHQAHPRRQSVQEHINNSNNNNNNNNNSARPPPELINAKDALISANHDQRPPVHPVDCPIVALKGHGLAGAKCGEVAEFTIDGSEAGPGKPEVRLSGAEDEIQVRVEKVADCLYKASYIAQTPGLYSLNVLWDNRQVAGCPISVNATGGCDPSKVLCTGDGLKGGVLGEEIKILIDTRRAGPGELTALCSGPQKVAFCELLDRGDGTFFLYIKPQEPGRQFLTIKYGGQHIPKSPFLIKVSGKPDPTKVRVYGPGVEHGVLSLYQSRFVCDTRGAGAGQLTVRIRGPKGAFRMETQRESQRDRTILCKYDPTEPGDYRIEIRWSDHHVPGSPFSVMIFDTQEELNGFLLSTGQKLSPDPHHTTSKQLAGGPLPRLQPAGLHRHPAKPHSHYA